MLVSPRDPSGCSGVCDVRHSLYGSVRIECNAEALEMRGRGGQNHPRSDSIALRSTLERHRGRGDRLPATRGPGTHFADGAKPVTLPSPNRPLATRRSSRAQVCLPVNSLVFPQVPGERPVDHPTAPFRRWGSFARHLWCLWRFLRLSGRATGIWPAPTPSEPAGFPTR